MIGTTFAHYRILDKIGAGGMGEVYRGHDEKLDRDVAIKVLPPGDLGDESARARLLSEARTASRLNHPNICTIHEVGEVGGQYYIAMEIVAGPTLKALVARGPLPVEQVLLYGSQITDALAHAHEHGVIHRDLKCANVVILPEGRAKLLDFGLAKRLRGTELKEVTEDVIAAAHAPGTETEEEGATQSQSAREGSGGIVGTLHYMAPEVLRGEPADARSDLWALGVVLFEVATGKRPFQGATGPELISAILRERPRPLPVELPAGLQTVIQRCLRKEPKQRYQRASEVRAALEALQSGAVTAAPRRPRTAARRKRGVSGKRIRSLVVLPLANLSPDPEQEYFVDGMTEALITGLAQLGALKVISRTSAMRYKGSEKRLPEIAAELNVDAVVDGSVFREGQRVRITSQLIHAATDTHLWAGSYERDLQDVLLLQGELAQAIAHEIKLVVTPERAKRLVSVRPLNPEAHEACLRARHHWYRLTPEGIATAMEYYQLALEKDPNCAPAYAGMAYLWLFRGETGVPPREAFPKATEAALKAIELEESLAEVHQVLAGVKLAYDWDWAAAEREFQRALELNPNLAEARFFYGDFLLCIRGSERGLAEVHRALELDPLNSLFQCFLGWHLLYLRRDDEAIAQLRKMLTREPNSAAARLGLWGAFRRKQQYVEALAEAQRYHALLGYGEVAAALSPGGGSPEYERTMAAVAERLVAHSRQTHVPRIRIARLYAHAAKNDQALDWLEKAYEERESPLTRLGVVWDWDTLRAEPRFQALLRRMNLPERPPAG